MEFLAFPLSMDDGQFESVDYIYAYALTRILEDDFDPDYVVEFILR